MILMNNLVTLKAQIAAAEQKYSRAAGSVTLLAVSKKQSVEAIRAAWNGGQRCFGENYLQEALDKMQELADLPIEWHFIGPIQSNKTKKIAEHFSWVHSIDSFRIAKRLNDQRPAHLPPLNICLEINTSGESSKSGIAPEETAALAAACRTLPHLVLRGLMTIPAPAANFTDQRQPFHALQTLKNSLNAQGFALDTLSMGMSADWEAAVAEGATIIRLGTAIFGERS